MKYFLTGISGFVGRYLVDRLLHQGHTIVGVDLVRPVDMPPEVIFCPISLMDASALKEVIVQSRPDRIIHLASASSVSYSWEKPVDCFVNNTNIFLNLLEAVRSNNISCRILSVGSSEEYGPVSPDDVPLKEDHPTNPMNPYAVARVAQEHLSKIYAKGYGLNIVCTRSFNHLGAGQDDRFVVSSFVRQAIEVAKGLRPMIVCGSLDIVRDFIDVRDVVHAYEVILDKGVSGEVYNVCSGCGISLKELLKMICHKAGIPFKFSQDSHLIRPIDNPVIIGSNTKLKRLGFELSYEMDSSLGDLIAWWMKKI